MPRINLQEMYRVDIIESESGWGSNIEETIYFDNKAEAQAYVEEYNAKHNPPGPTPSWYMLAQYVGKVR